MKENKTYNQGYWKEHSEGWSASGLTQEAYCAQEGISFKHFLYQHHRLKNKPKKNAIHFIEMKAPSALKSNLPEGLQVMLPNNIRIGINGEINEAILQTVFRLAGELRC